jgi:L-ascorbate metabolism protein UlaG (beta-lactamase superfamily)
MKRSLAALIIGLLVAGPAVAAAKSVPTVKITWHGQSFFEVTSSKGTTVVIDPHAIIEYGRIDGVFGHVILNSHFHNDHTQNQVVENFKEKTAKWPKAKVIEGLKRAGTGESWNTIDEDFKDFHIRTVGTYHDTTEGMQRGKNAVFILKVDGITIVHLGDLGHVLSKAQVKAIGPVDVLLIPVGGVYTINGSEAKDVVAQLKPKKYIIPMHCATKVYEDVLSVKEFLEDQKREDIAVSSDNTLVVRTDYKPSAPTIAVLNWEPAPKRKKRDQDK